VDTIVEQWRRERPDVDVAALATIARLIRSVHLAQTMLGPPLRGIGLEPGWFDLLAALRRTGAPFELNPTELMRATLLSSGGMTKRLDRLVEAGLVERRPDPDDRRGTLVRLTRKGRARIDEALAAHAAREDELLDVLSATDRRTLDRLLRALLADLERRAGRDAAP